jgi:hypothetical protein
VLANDIDVDSPVLTTVLVAGRRSGTLTFSPTGAFTYTPATDYNGPDSFSYVVDDGAPASSSATVAINRECRSTDARGGARADGRYGRAHRG